MLATSVVGVRGRGADGARVAGSPGWVLAGWMLLLLATNSLAWMGGMRGAAIAMAVERGAARVERNQLGEVPDDAIRKAIQTQQDTLVFWATLSALGDFLFDPLSMAVRAVLAAVLLSGAAAVVGRSVRFEDGLYDCVTLQGLWVLGRMVQVGLMLWLGRGEVETSPVLLLPSGTYAAWIVLGLRQFEVFATLGWLAMAWRGWRRGEANLVVALLCCAGLLVCESLIRVAWAVLIGGGMRLSVLPG